MDFLRLLFVNRRKELCYPLSLNTFSFSNSILPDVWLTFLLSLFLKRQTT